MLMSVLYSGTMDVRNLKVGLQNLKLVLTLTTIVMQIGCDNCVAGIESVK